MTDGDRRRHECRRVDARDGAVGAVRHPDGIRAGCDRRRIVSDADRCRPSPRIGVDPRDEAIGVDDPDRTERRERRAHAPPKNEPEAATGRVEVSTVVPRVDLRDAACAVGHPHGGLRGGERRRRIADRNGSDGLSRREVDAGHALVVEVRDPQRARAGGDRDRSSADRDGRCDRAGRVEGDDRVRGDGRAGGAAEHEDSNDDSRHDHGRGC